MILLMNHMDSTFPESRTKHIVLEPMSYLNVKVLYHLILIAPELDLMFTNEAKEHDLIELLGQYGGMRASMYNGMPIEGARKLKDFMVEFA